MAQNIKEDAFLTSGLQFHECTKKDCWYCDWMYRQAIKRDVQSYDSFRKFITTMNIKVC